VTRALAFLAGGLIVYIASYAARQLLVHAEEAHLAEIRSGYDARAHEARYP
jgi:hypothetical protein